MINKVYYTWKDCEHMVTTINNLMFADNWRPDYIVGLTRGGLVPAVIMSNATGIPMHALDVRFRDTNEDYGPESNTWMAEDALGYDGTQDFKNYNRKNILIMDDINDSGRTLKWIKNDWRGGCLPDSPSWDTLWGDTVRTACLIDNGASGFGDCDYTAQEINKEERDVWVVFPWEGERNYGNT
jgi:hypoxanthine phosphoribosyltransferase|tara:strand:- start:50 stop:598 length:549 start_codon:yes stop_codon:yes gene_type:complete